jgi:Zn-dependent oligopeptidase
MIATKILPKLNFKLGAEDILRECRSTIKNVREEFDRIGSVPVNECSFEKVLKPWSQVEARFTTEIASYSFPQYVSSVSEIREASVEASRMIDEFNIEISMREDLFRVARAVSEKKEELPSEEARFLEKILLEFKHNGLFLDSEASRSELKKKRQRLADLCTDFSKTMNDDATELLFSEEELEGATKDFLSSLPRDESGKYRVSMKYPDLFGVLRNVKKESVRALMDTTNGRKCESNRAVFAEALKLRQECASLLGYSDHAHFRLEDKMAKTPEKVSEFLRELQQKLTPFARTEMEKLRSLKVEEAKKNASDLASFDEKSIQLRSWDYQYYTRVLLEREYSLDEELVREYFSLTNVIGAMLDIFEEVLCLRFKQVEGAFAAGLVWHEDVTLWEVWNSGEAMREGFSEDSEFVGHFYLDLFPRPGKYTHAACWDLQPGYDRCESEGAGRQYPVAGMVANFTKPTGDKPSLLKHDEVVTLFHELGHAMHDMCAHVRLSRFHGTSVEGDFVEAPSQMLENWCWQDSILRRLSQHYLRPSEPLPDSLIASLVRTKNLNAGLQNLRQIFFATWDLIVHGRDFDVSAVDAEYERLRHEIALIGQADNVWPAASFGHMMGGYDAGYYGYMWSQVFSADMFYTRFASHLDSKPSVPGLQYRKSILRVGGSRDGMDSLKEFLGREPIPEPFLKSLGLMD